MRRISIDFYELMFSLVHSLLLSFHHFFYEAKLFSYFFRYQKSFYELIILSYCINKKPPRNNNKERKCSSQSYLSCRKSFLRCQTHLYHLHICWLFSILYSFFRHYWFKCVIIDKFVSYRIITCSSLYQLTQQLMIGQGISYIPDVWNKRHASTKHF